MIDSRCGRVLQEGHRQMVGDAEFSWIEAQTEDRDFDHLLVGTSVPWLLPRALHDIEAADEQLTAGVRGRLIARLAERVRRAVDLEHWAAFNDSFERLARLFGRIGRAGPDGACTGHDLRAVGRRPPHLHQRDGLPGSDGRQDLPADLLADAQQHPAADAARVLAGVEAVRQPADRQVSRFGRVPAASIDWRTTAGPYFGNYLAMLRFDGRTATFGLEKSAFDGPVTAPPRSTTRGSILTAAQPVRG